ncbi:hypothetical protein KFK09_006841 [Dendrobium nobile]|uniref:Uncharacterized protein n=1 Tax=Dendrobium nobile TaxID=94219 RepID=A0A8T3BQ84_DENNO|nr:hypothetical protein KFK09_006841 [Dendrobium nobile]
MAKELLQFDTHYRLLPLNNLGRILATNMNMRFKEHYITNLFAEVRSHWVSQ